MRRRIRSRAAEVSSSVSSASTRRRPRLEARPSCSRSRSAPTAPLFLGPLGWTQVGKLRIWARPLPRVSLRRGRAEQIERFEFDGDAASGWPNHIVRDAEYLNWRYLDSPRDYVAYRAGGGYAVLGHKRHRGHPIALVADLVGPVRPLLRACVAGVKPGTRALFGLPGPGEAAAYASCGFVPTPMSLDFMGKPLAGELDPGSAFLAVHARRHGLLLMQRLVFLTQSVDPEHPVLAATIPKIRALAERVDEVVVLATVGRR